MTTDLFAPFQLGDLTLANRAVMAPMARNRADENGVAPPRRYRDNLHLSMTNPATFYGGGEAGYVDYPVYRSEYLVA
jgi:hypothetical protein